MENDTSESGWLNLSDLPVFLKQQVAENLESGRFTSRKKLYNRLQSLISKFLSEATLDLDAREVEDSFKDIPEWSVENVLAKLRSITEINAKLQIRLFCRNLDETKRQSTQHLLNNAGLHKFRESIEIDLYVGIHTAISAYYKMIGVALSNKQRLGHFFSLEQSTDSLFRALKCVASQPLASLMKLDGLFWDSRLYTIPKSIRAEISGNNLIYLVSKAELQRRLLDLKVNEERLGCPALKARTSNDENSLDLIGKICMKTVKQFSKLV